MMDSMILHIEPLLLSHRVNIGFYGHNHVVQRHSAVYKKKVVQKSVVRNTSEGEVHVFRNPQATVHMVIGTAGAGFTENAQTPRPEWNEMFFYKWGYARVVAHNSTDLSWEWVESSSGTVFDRMAISQITDFSENPKWIDPDMMGDDWYERSSRNSAKREETVAMRVLDFFCYGYGFLFVAFLCILLMWAVVFFLFPSSHLTTTDTPGSGPRSRWPWSRFWAPFSWGHETYTMLQQPAHTQSESVSVSELHTHTQSKQNPLYITIVEERPQA